MTRIDYGLANGCWGDHFVDGPHFAAQLLVLDQRQRLCTVGQRVLGLIVNLDYQTIGANRDARARQRCDHKILPRTMRRIDDHRQV